MGVRYSKIENKNKREIVLLKGLPCKYGKCKFCNYIEDNSENLEEIDRVNKETLEEVTGEFGALEV
ncbi:MAG: radical SAM protein, partial [Cetobacterium sp.]